MGVDATITSNIFQGNFIGIMCPNADNIHINFNRFFKNTNYGVFVTHSKSQHLVDGTLNWWGSNLGPNQSSNDKTAGLLDYTPWMTLKYSIPKTSIISGTKVPIIASFLTDSYGIYHDPKYGHMPDGILVRFTSNLGQVGSYVIWQETINGVAQVYYRAVDPNGRAIVGADVISVSVDNEVISNTVEVVPSVNAATVGMQETGIPLAGLILAVLMLFSGIITSKR